MTFTENFSQYAVSKLPTFRDDFSGTDDWVDIGTKIAVNTATDVIDFDADTNGVNEATSFDLGAGNVSDINWVLRFKFDIDSITNPDTNVVAMTMGISNLPSSTARSGAQDFIGIEAVIDSGGNTWQTQDTNGTAITGGSADNQFTLTPVTGIVYVEIKRLTITTGECNLYSDNNFTDLIESQPITLSVGTSGLRYIKFMGVDNVTSTNTLIGTIDDVEFWNEAQQGDVTFQDDFTVDNWADAGTQNQVNTGTGVLDFDFDRVITTIHKTVFDLGVGNVSDTNWTLRWKQVNDTVIGNAGISTLGYIGIMDSDQNFSPFGAQDFIGIECFVNDGANSCRLKDVNGQSLAFGSGVYTFTDPIAVNTRFWELKRLSATTIIAKIYSDSTYETLIETSGVQTISPNVIGLRYIAVANNNQATSLSSHDGTLDDIEFYNGVSVAKTPVKSTDEDFEDSFFEDNWTDAGTQHSVNTGTRVIDWNASPKVAGGIDQTTFDLETIFTNGVNPTKWGLRFKFTYGGTITGTGASTQFAVFLTSSASGISSEAGQDHATWKVQAGAGTFYAGIVDDGTQIFTGNAVSMGSDLVPAGGTGYGEMIRNGNLWTFAVYSDSDFTQLLGNKLSINETVDTVGTLRFLKVGKRDVAGTVTTFDGTVDNIQFWNGDEPTEHGTQWVEVNLP